MGDVGFLFGTQDICWQTWTTLTWWEQSGVSFTCVVLLLIMQPVSCDVASGHGVLHTPMFGIYR